MIGTIAVYGINWHHRYAHVGISLDPKVHNQGCGTDAMRILLRFIFEEMNLNKVKLEVFEFNPPAIRVYEKCGFRREGRLREEIFRYGRYHDVLVMGLLQEEHRSKTG
ncbi:spermidine N1-acetyltransferase [Desmospora sp. 8437]|nr:spermidine N1-acetyltransferase [Desmospora sp. 8437]